MVCAPEFDRIVLNRLPESAWLSWANQVQAQRGTEPPNPGEKSTESSKTTDSGHGCLNSSAHRRIIHTLGGITGTLINGIAPDAFIPPRVLVTVFDSFVGDD